MIVCCNVTLRIVNQKGFERVAFSVFKCKKSQLTIETPILIPTMTLFRKPNELEVDTDHLAPASAPQQDYDNDHCHNSEEQIKIAILIDVIGRVNKILRQRFE